jgi:dTDP-4-amino-4,6-dideoxygalactose transaminase
MSTVEDGIPLVDLGVQHLQIASEVAEGFNRVIASGAFVGGSDVACFEKEFARFCGTRHCIGVANGTDALELLLRAIGIGPGDEVLLPANTFVATAEAVVRAGGTVALVDCDPVHHLIDVKQVADRLGPKTKAVIGVDLFGQMPAMEELAAVTDAAGIMLLEDAAQAQGAMRGGQTAGSFGLAAGTSFYPGKNLGAYGDAGAVLTDSEEIDQAVRALRNHGGEARYEHTRVGFNSRLDTLQAVVLRAKLTRLHGWNNQRRRAAAHYDELLADRPDVTLPATLAGNEHVWHLYVIRVPRRDRVLSSVRASGIGAGVHYPVPVHLQRGFRDLGYGPGAFPIAEEAAGQILSLPLFPGITEAQQERVVDALCSALG